MSWEQLREWLLYYMEEPFGEQLANLRAGSIAAAVYNVHRNPGSEMLTARDCAIEFRKPVSRKPPTPEEQAKIFRARFDQFKHMVIAVATQ